jgi:hypothetical protein
MTKPDVAKVHQVLRKHNALIVHFSSVPKLDLLFYFPEDLRHALNKKVEGGLCCSVVMPGDGVQNAFGTVGLIFDLVTPDSLIAVSSGDGGAGLRATGLRDFDPKYRTFDDAVLERSICNRPSDSHNEWGVQNYIVRGLFLLESQAWVALPSDQSRRVSADDLYDFFPGQRIYSFVRNDIVELHPRSGAVIVDHSEIYR